MPAHKYTILQIGIICFLTAIIGVRLVSQFPEWFNGQGRNSVQTSATQSAAPFITLGSATSTEDSGFLDHVVPIFEAATGIDVHVEAVGTGQALAEGARGNVDVLLVHDRAEEENFVADGDGIDRRDVMYNDFVIVGPSFNEKKSGASPEGEDANPSLANNHQERNFPGPQVHEDQSSLGPTLRVQLVAHSVTSSCLRRLLIS